MPIMIPGALIPFIPLYWPLADGTPNSGGKIQFYITGTTTPKDTFAQADMDPASVNTNPVILGTNGRPLTPLGAPNGAIFLQPGGYDAIVYDADDVELYSVEGFEDIGQTFFASLGTLMSEGSKDVTDGYQILPTDNTITLDTAASAVTVTLPLAADRTSVDSGNGFPLFILVDGANNGAIARTAPDTMNGLTADFSIGSSAGQQKPWVLALSDGVSNWILLASPGVA